MAHAKQEDVDNIIATKEQCTVVMGNAAQAQALLRQLQQRIELNPRNAGADFAKVVASFDDEYQEHMKALRASVNKIASLWKRANK